MGRKSNEQKKKESHQKAVLKYDNKTYKKITFRFHREKDKNILDHIDKQENKNQYIKDLILADMEKGKQ